MRLAAAAVIAFATTTYAQPAAPADAVPVDAIPAILDLFKTYQVVGLGEGPHGNLEGAAFRLKLLRDPRFGEAVDDILVESGTARYQDVMDRYVRGEAVSRDELRKAWEDTTNPGTNWDKPMYAEFFAAVRDVNKKLPDEKKLRVLLGDPPIAWEFVRNRAGFKMITISTRYANLIKIQPSVAQWKTPSFAMIRGTTIGRKFYAQFYPMPPAPGWNRVLMEDQFDAVLYLSPKQPTMTLMPKSLCLDAGYMKMRIARLNAVAPASADQLKKLCADLTR